MLDIDSGIITLIIDPPALQYSAISCIRPGSDNVKCTLLY